ASRPTVNVAKPNSNIFHKSHSPVRRSFNQRAAPKYSDLKEKVNTAKVNNVTTVGPKAVVTVVQGNGENAVKSSTCWIWRPTRNVIDHVSKDNSGSWILKRFDYEDPQGRLKSDQGIFDSRCSRYMTGDKSYLTDYQEIDGGFVAFGGSPKGELKFNLFSVSQMCDKKNNVLLTETECLILSPDFKLIDESQVLLKVPRQNNSKAFRVFNTRTRKVEENLHIKFLENKSNVAESGPKWLFDIDSLTKSMNYEPVIAGNQTNGDAGIETNANAGKARQEKASDHEFILLPLMPSNSPLSSSTQSSDDNDTDEVPSKGDDDVNKVSGSDDQERTNSSTQNINIAGPSINTTSTNINTGSLNINTVSPNVPSLEESGIFDGAYDDEDVGAEADLNNLETTMNVSPIPTTRIHKDHPKDQIIGDLNLAPQTRRMIKFSKENAMVSYINRQRRTNHKDYQNCVGNTKSIGHFQVVLSLSS
ncbi:hypothetical protein Tco_1396608, partial [Tanacetum coccineum]